MKKRDNLKSIFQIFFGGLFLLCASAEAFAGQFFQTQNTWYQKIPSNPVLFSHSSDFIADILINGSSLGINYGEWSVPIYYAPSGTANVTVALDDQYPYSKALSLENGWNVVPIPEGAHGAGDTAYCAGSSRDGHMVVYNDQYVWEFYHARKCSGQPWRASKVNRWSRSGDGIEITDTEARRAYRSCRAAAGATLAHGIVTKADIDSGVINHALAFGYYAEGDPSGSYRSEYPCYTTRYTVSKRQYAMHIGMRLQLDPSVDCNSLGLNNFGKMICKALQDYGAIFVDNTSPGDNSIFVENRANGAQAYGDWEGVIGFISSIPINRMRVVEPVCSDSNYCPNTPGGGDTGGGTTPPPADTIPPAPPSIIGVQ
jgi:hypothetical protein